VVSLSRKGTANSSSQQLKKTTSTNTMPATLPWLQKANAAKD